jgi:hypothetical protein
MSMDEIDVATDHIEKTLASQIAEARAVKPEPLTGVCANCGDVAKAASRFCNVECREDHEHRSRQNKRSGVR